MRRTCSWVVNRGLFISAGVIALSALIVSPARTDETKEVDVGTRAVPGVPSQQGQMPTFPQNFAVQGQESASFGFAVTQPGPVVVDVQTQGAPVMVTLQNLAALPMTQQGSGHVHMAFQVTPQYVQKSALWTVRIQLVQPAMPLGAAHATGTVMAQHPPADPAIVQAQVSTAAAQNQANRQHENEQAHARMDAAFQAHKTKFDQERQQRQAAERAQNQPVLDQIRAKGGKAGLWSSQGAWRALPTPLV